VERKGEERKEERRGEKERMCAFLVFYRKNMQITFISFSRSQAICPYDFIGLGGGASRPDK
jgi:hypothetical protein